jgi:hypothetical protein
LEKLLADRSLCSTHTVDDVTYTTQFRDIALVALLHLHGENPVAYGFKHIRTHAQYAYSPYTIGFASDDDRQAAFAQWEAFRAADAPAENPADVPAGSE